MKIIQEVIARTATLETCLQQATLHHPPHNSLSPNFIRESIAEFINDHTPSMILAPIRIRPRQERNHQGPPQQIRNTNTATEIIDLYDPSLSQKALSSQTPTHIVL